MDTSRLVKLETQSLEFHRPSDKRERNVRTCTNNDERDKEEVRGFQAAQPRPSNR